MILQFHVGNHRSFCEEQEFSLVASSLSDPKEGLFQNSAVSGINILPAAIIYGPNASGKSNFISAIRFFKDAILESHRSGKPGDPVPRRPFALKKEFEDCSTVFDMDFILNETRYVYGFECNDRAIIKEWLYSYPKKYKRLLFERKGDDFQFGRSLPGQNKIIASLTRDNSLFLSAAAQNDHDVLSPIVDYFSRIEIDQAVSVRGAQVASRLKGAVLDERVIQFLEKIGTGVTSYRLAKQELPEEAKKISEAISKAIKSEVSNFENIEFHDLHDDQVVELGHNVEGEPVKYFKIEWESAGTRRLLLLMGKVFAALDEGRPIFVDELDASLHTFACEAVLELFCTKEFNPNGAQLIATTHDTNVLRSKFLRRDQVWFTEKDRNGATQLFPLTDIRTRKGDNIEVGYLQGRFGAVPFSGSVYEFLLGGRDWLGRTQGR